MGAIKEELKRRQDIWSKCKGRPLSAREINTLRAFLGGRGMWVDKTKHTGVLAADGVTVGVLHKGDIYNDDLYDDSILYHYPETDTPGRDRADVQATKNAHELGLPVFVSIGTGKKQASRQVRLARVDDWDDHQKKFLMSFIDAMAEAETPAEIEEEKPFSTEDKSGKKKRKPSTRQDRSGQSRFRFNVLKRSGAMCMVCDLQVDVLLEAAHIRPKEKNGTDDSRNGMPLCRNHHKAFDGGLFKIHPESLEIVPTDPGVSKNDLQIINEKLDSSRNMPHKKALAWAWNQKCS